MRLWIVLVLTNLLNVFDALATYEAVVRRKIAVELNPLMDYLLQCGPWWFFTIKLVVLGVGCTGVLWLIRDRKAARRALWFIFWVYVLIALSHIVQWLIYTGYSEAWYRAWFGTRRSSVRIGLPRPILTGLNETIAGLSP